MKVVIQDDNGNDLSTFLIPNDAESVNRKQAHEMGRNIARSINKLIPQLISYDKKLMDNCTCFWKEYSEEERKFIRTHSSECGIWDMK